MDGEGRYTRSWKCQVSVGELYRWILAKLSDKDIKRALHKYRDLMPRQSDWNRKLTQATNVPELGFRYLYRCGQIDESNHRTMQKMLKYIDRQDVLPYFDTILYNSNSSNCSIEELQKQLLDRVDVFLRASTALTEDEVHPEPPYEIQRQSLEDRRFTRSLTKRKSCEPLQCMTFAKRSRRQFATTRDDSSSSSLDDQDASASCGRAYSAIKACTLSGPALQTLFNTSLSAMLSVIQFSNSPSSSNPTSSRSSNSTMANLSNFLASNSLYNAGLLNHPRVPNLISMIHLHLGAMRNTNRPIETLPFAQTPLLQSNGAPDHRAEQIQQQLGQCGGVDVAGSDNETLIHYICRIRMRIKLDLGNSRSQLQNFIASERPDPFSRQVDIYLQAMNLLRNRNGSEFICILKFSRLDQLEAFWSDYTSGALKKLLVENLLGSDKTAFVGYGSWLESDSTANAPTEAPAAPGPSRRHSTSRRNQATSSGRSSSTFSPLNELQNVMLSMRRQIYNASSVDVSPAAAAAQAAAHAIAQQNGPHIAFANVLGIGHAHVRLQNLPTESQAAPPTPAPDFDISLFVPRLEYENGRMLLMRNERAIPSLPRLMAASQIVFSTPSNTATSSNFPSTSGAAIESDLR